MRIKGHPVHMMLVHFPSALLPAYLLLRLWEYGTDSSFAGATTIILFVAVVTGWAAILTGVPELMRLLKSGDETLIKTGFWHAGINCTVIFFFTVLLAFACKGTGTPKLVALGMEAAGIVVMFAGNAFGGTIITRFLKF